MPMNSICPMQKLHYTLLGGVFVNQWWCGIGFGGQTKGSFVGVEVTPEVHRRLLMPLLTTRFTYHATPLCHSLTPTRMLQYHSHPTLTPHQSADDDLWVILKSRVPNICHTVTKDNVLFIIQSPWIMSCMSYQHNG